MADDADYASLNQEIQNELALKNRPKPLRYLGWCRNCEEPLPHPKVFCDKDCGDDYARLQLNAINID